MKGWALVTGAGQRIGQAIALDLAAQGWDIIVHYNRSGDAAKAVAEEIHALGQDAVLAEIDLSQAQMAENLIPSLAEELGMIDALVNNASIFESDDKDADGARHWAVNADAPRLLSKSFKAHMAKSERGVIVNLLDAALLEKPAGMPRYAGYSKSKVFLAEMTRNMAKSFAPQIRVNGVAPGFVLPSAGQSEAAFQKLSGGKTVTPEQVAVSVRQLIESPAVTGQVVTVA